MEKIEVKFSTMGDLEFVNDENFNKNFSTALYHAPFTMGIL